MKRKIKMIRESNLIPIIAKNLDSQQSKVVGDQNLLEKKQIFN